MGSALADAGLETDGLAQAAPVHGDGRDPPRAPGTARPAGGAHVAQAEVRLGGCGGMTSQGFAGPAAARVRGVTGPGQELIPAAGRRPARGRPATALFGRPGLLRWLGSAHRRAPRMRQRVRRV